MIIKKLKANEENQIMAFMIPEANSKRKKVKGIWEICFNDNYLTPRLK